MESPAFNAHSVDSDQMLRTVASDVSLHCLQMPILCNAKHKRVQHFQYFTIKLSESISQAIKMPLYKYWNETHINRIIELFYTLQIFSIRVLLCITVID